MKPLACPRCGGGFDCGAEDGYCECFEIRLDDAARAEIASRYDGCLCLKCLREIAAAAPAPPPAPPG